MRRRGPGKTRDEFPATRLYHLRKLPRHAIQSRDARYRIWRKKYLSGARPQYRGSARVLRADSESPSAARSFARYRSRLLKARPDQPYLERRRGAAHEAGHASALRNERAG